MIVVCTQVVVQTRAIESASARAFVLRGFSRSQSGFNVMRISNKGSTVMHSGLVLTSMCWVGWCRASSGQPVNIIVLPLH